MLLRDPFPKYQGMMEMWKRDAVPAERSRSARSESRNIVLEVGDDHLHNLWRETAWVWSIRMPMCEDTYGFGFGTAPNSDNKELDPWNRIMRCDGGENGVGFAGYLVGKA